MKSPAEFKGIMPYASELLGIYQPLRRWAFRILDTRFEKFRNALYANVAEQTRSSQRAPLPGQLERQSSAELATDTERQAPSISSPKPVAFVSEVLPPLAPDIDCGIARLLQRDIGSNPPGDWRRLITTELMTVRLEKFKTIVTQPAELQNFPDIAAYVQSFNQAIGPSDQAKVMQSMFDKEARLSGFLLFLARHKPTQLNDIFFTVPQAENHPAGLTIMDKTARHLGHM